MTPYLEQFEIEILLRLLGKRPKFCKRRPKAWIWQKRCKPNPTNTNPEWDKILRNVDSIWVNFLLKNYCTFRNKHSSETEIIISLSLSLSHCKISIFFLPEFDSTWKMPCDRDDWANWQNKQTHPLVPNLKLILPLWKTFPERNPRLVCNKRKHPTNNVKYHNKDLPGNKKTKTIINNNYFLPEEMCVEITKPLGKCTIVEKF